MIHKLMSIIEFFVFMLITIAVFYLSDLYPDTKIYIIEIVVITCTLGIILYRINLRHEHNIRRITHEISVLHTDLVEKETLPFPDELKDFYVALEQAKNRIEKKGRMRQELLNIASSVASFMEIEKLMQDMLPKLIDVTRSNCAAFYSINRSTNKLEIKHSVGFSKNIYSEFDMRLGEGFFGKAAECKDISVLKDLPDDINFTMRTVLGKVKPRSLMVVPVSAKEEQSGVLVCASVFDYNQEDLDLIDLVRHYLGMAVSNGANYEKTKRMANEMTFQNKLIQEQYEKMKKQLDEKTLLLSNWVNSADWEHSYAVDSKGRVLVWSRNAEKLHGINAKTAVGKPIDKLYEENNWPSIAKALQTAITNGQHKENLLKDNEEYEWQMTCIYNERKEVLGVIVSIKKGN